MKFPAGILLQTDCSLNKITIMIKISNLEKYYRTEEVETIALNKLSLEVKEG